MLAASAMRERSKTGRPPKGSEAVRREAILAAARRVFARVGFGAATMDAIAREANAAKRTLYAHFGDKAALFRAVVAAEAGAILAAPGAAPGLRGRLVGFARGVFERIHTEEKAAIFRMVVAEARAFPALARDFHRNGPGRGVGVVAGLLREAASRGEIVCADPRAEARRFSSLLIGDSHLRLVLGLAKPPTRAAARAEAEATVDFFLRALAR
ncbi:MAG: TetR/AcrR family transcriptional regulator [Azospirillum sp.]|jgi:AcrR family transcriptional regulator|nr:TetR/AcrR family transcriptional regulator [Azospirillum sp.]